MHYIVCDLKKGMTKKNILLVKPLPPYLSYMVFFSPFPTITTIHDVYTAAATTPKPDPNNSCSENKSASRQTQYTHQTNASEQIRRFVFLILCKNQLTISAKKQQKNVRFFIILLDIKHII